MTGGDKRNFKLLIVDDEEDIRDWFEELFEDHDYTVYLAKDGNNALGILKKGFLPDCILTDEMMPGMGGYELCERLKKNIKIRDIPVIMITGRISEEEELTGYEKGVSLYIRKADVKEDILLEQVEKWCVSRRKLRELQQKLRDARSGLKSEAIMDRAYGALLEVFANLPYPGHQTLVTLVYDVIRQKFGLEGGVFLHLDSLESGVFAPVGSKLYPDMVLTYAKKGVGIHHRDPFTAVVLEHITFLGINFFKDDVPRQIQTEIIQKFLDMLLPLLLKGKGEPSKELSFEEKTLSSKRKIFS